MALKKLYKKMVAIDPYLSIFVGVSLFIILIGLLFRFFKQPFIIAYIVTGIIIGPHALKLISDTGLISHIGNLGVVILLFFIGMEISLPRLLSNWKIPIIGTFFQVLISFLVVFGIGNIFGWPLGQDILLGFVITLSSTALIIKILEEHKELDTQTGNNVLGVLLVQDLAVIPMLIIISLLGKEATNISTFILQLTLGIAIIGAVIWLFKHRKWKLPFSEKIKKDHELQVFAALFICFGLALITGLFQLSAALGAFIAGIIVSAAQETKWVHQSLHSFQIVFVAAFFVSIGMLINLNFVLEHLGVIFLIVVVVLLTNTTINAFIFKLLGESLRESLYSGALLSQIGEFSFVLAAIGLQVGLIASFGYQITLAVISISMLLSPFGIALFRKVKCCEKKQNTIS